MATDYNASRILSPMNKKLYPLIDPRGVQQRPVITLAPRPTLEQLKNGKILFYDNTKLSFCNYGEVFVRIKERFREMGISNFVDYRETVRGKTHKGSRTMRQCSHRKSP